MISLTLILLVSSGLCAAEPVRINCIVACDASSPRVLKIKADIQDLPAEDVRLLLPDSEVTNFELLYGNDRLEENREESEDHPESWSGREILLNGRNSERASISYQVKLSDRFSLEKHSYGDGRRCILYPFEILPNFEERESRSNVSFQLPPAWVVITTAKKVGKGFSSVGNKLEEVFYLGKASSQQLSYGQTEIALAVEAAWEPSKEMVLDILRQQILYQEKIVKEGKSRSLLVALVESLKSVGELRFSTLNNSSGFSASAPFSPWNLSEFQEALRRGVSKCLLECFFPSLRFAKRSTVESYVLEYFLMKSDLKRGLLPKEKFLQQIAEGFEVMSVEKSTTQRRMTLPSTRTMARALPTDEEWISNLFLLDLALNFFGKTANSLEQLVHERTSIASLEKILDGDFPRGVVRDSNLISQLKIVFHKEEFADISQRLRPFGLVFESREIADLSFDLNENFQVERIRKMDEDKNGNLQLGDKVISVAERRLLRPIDLIKRRSELNPGQDITLVLERGGVVLKIKQRVGRERLVRLEANRLSDADKQEKLEKFWEREPGG